MTTNYDITGAVYIHDVTTFTPQVFLDAVMVMGNSLEQVREIQMHLAVFKQIADHNLTGRVLPSCGRSGIAFMGIPVKIAGSCSGNGVFGTMIVPKDDTQETVCLLTREY